MRITCPNCRKYLGPSNYFTWKDVYTNVHCGYCNFIFIKSPMTPEEFFKAYLKPKDIVTFTDGSMWYGVTDKTDPKMYLTKLNTGDIWRIDALGFTTSFGVEPVAIWRSTDKISCEDTISCKIAVTYHKIAIFPREKSAKNKMQERINAIQKELDEARKQLKDL